MLLKQNDVFDGLSNGPTALTISFDDDKKTLLSVKKVGKFLIVKEQNKIPFKIFYLETHI